MAKNTKQIDLNVKSHTCYLNAEQLEFLKENCLKLTGKDLEDVKNITEYLLSTADTCLSSVKYIDTPETLEKISKLESSVKENQEVISSLKLENEKLNASILVCKEENKVLIESSETLESQLKDFDTIKENLDKELKQSEISIKELIEDNKRIKTEKQLKPDESLIVINSFKHQFLQKLIKNQKVFNEINQMNQAGKYDNFLDLIDTDNESQNFFNFLFNYFVRTDINGKFCFNVIDKKSLAVAYNNFLKNE